METILIIWGCILAIAVALFLKNLWNYNSPERQKKRDARKSQKIERQIVDRFYSAKPR